MIDIRIRQACNGTIVYDTPKERYEETGGEHVFNSNADLFAFIERLLSPEVPIIDGLDLENSSD